MKMLKRMGIQEGSAFHDYCVFQRCDVYIVHVGPAQFVFDKDGKYEEVDDGPVV